MSQPRPETIQAALRFALRAPSVHNSQPWRWHFAAGALHLYADRARHLPATDPEQRALLLSCGAALHHALVALAALGWGSEVTYTPDPRDRDHLATVRLARRAPTSVDICLAAAILVRRSDRRRFANGQVPQRYLAAAVDYAGRFGAQVRPVEDAARGRLGELMRVATEQHAEDALYQVELASWSGRRAGLDGVPARNATPVRAEDGLPIREFADPVLVDAAGDADAAQWLLVCTDRDDHTARLRAGETLSALLLAATDLRLGTCVQTEPLGVPALREEIRFALCDSSYPQAMVRAGWMRISAAPLAETPRRDLAEVFTGDAPALDDGVASARP
ncbi:NAD(P)H nitroreductase [Nocardia sp. JMUB6875]|uniref:Acg family FMN-binding oxidoreductase n=1 Tax=Nocardia sp. JMUB6875 TaxID=3158170 RepID=UPI0032E5E97E